MSAVAEYVMPEHEAQRLTNRITLIAGTVREGMEKLYSLVDEAKQGNAHVALGYPSWTAYLADTLGKTPLRLEREERREVVGYLAGEGMSTRAIAPIVGVSPRQVVTDRREGESGVKSLHTSESLPPFDPRTGEVIETPAEAVGAADDAVQAEPEERVEPTPAPRPPVTGMDGKTYTRPEPRQPSTPKRRPLPDVAREVGLDLRKVTERVERLTTDDRFTANKNEVAAHLRHHLAYATKVLTDLDNAINN